MSRLNDPERRFTWSGDVQLYLALAVGLQRAGHSVTLSSAAQYETFVLEHGVPFSPINAEFPNPILPQSWRLGGWGNRLSYGLTSLAGAMFGDVLRAWREETLGKAHRPAPAQNAPVLHAYSPRVVARPADWPSHAHVTGFWFLEAAPGWTPPAELDRFLAAGPAPVYVGFGSMTTKDAARKAGIVLEAIRRSGQRALLARG